MASASSILGIGGTILGNIIAPGVGGGIGGLLGSLAGSAFDPEQPDVPEYQNYGDPRIAAIINRLMRSKLGEQQASVAAARNTRNVNRQMEALGNDPRFSGNPITTAAIRKDATMGAEEANVNARLAGAQLDQQAMERAAGLQAQNNQFSLQRNAFEQGRYQLQQQPTGLDVLASNAVGYALGNWLGGSAEQPQGQEPRGGQQELSNYNQLFNQTQPDYFGPNSTTKILQNRPPAPNYFENFTVPQVQQYRVPPLPSFNFTPYQQSGYNFNYGRSPFRF